MDAELSRSKPRKQRAASTLRSDNHSNGRYSPKLSDAELLAGLRVIPDAELSDQFRLPECQNIVTCVHWRVDINLQKFAEHYRCVEYTPKRFAAAKIRLAKPSTTALIFKNGIVVCVGAKTQESARLACQKHRRLISRLGYHTKFQRFRIRNRVYAIRVSHPISLVHIHENPELLEEGNKLGSQWEPEQFPGLIYKMHSPDLKLTIFDSGSVNIIGVKRSQDAIDAWHHVYPVLSELHDRERPMQPDDRFAYRLKRKLHDPRPTT